jgi:hypothetical protein
VVKGPDDALIFACITRHVDHVTPPRIYDCGNKTRISVPVCLTFTELSVVNLKSSHMALVLEGLVDAAQRPKEEKGQRVGS